MQKSIVLLLKRTITSLVVVSFLLQPLSVLAEEAAPGAESAPEVSASDSILLNESEAVAWSESVTNNSQNSNQQLNLAKSISGKDKAKTANDLVNQFTGAAGYSYDVNVPAGRNNQTPRVALKYLSQRKNSLENLSGFGWELGTDYIVRDTTNGYDNIFTKDDFVVSSVIDNGRLIKTATTSNKFLLKHAGDYKEYFFENNNWLVKDGTGNKYFFGVVNDSRQASSTQPSLVYKWYLDKIEDTNGNAIEYKYFKDEGQVYLKSITYTADQVNQGDFEVRFYPFYSNPTTPNRADIKANYNPGFKVQTRFKLDSIEVVDKTVVKKKINLTYEPAPVTSYSLLKSIKESYLDSENVWQELPLTSFNYSQMNYQDVWSNGSVNADLPYMTLLNDNLTNQIHQDGDINGDGLIDFVKTKPTLDIPMLKEGYISRPNGTWQNLYNWTSFPEPFQYDPTEYEHAIRGGAVLLDVNNDSKVDIFRSSIHFENGYSTTTKRLYINNGNNTWSQASSSIPFILAGNALEAYRFADINGDRLVDALLSYDYVFNDSGHQIRRLMSAAYINSGNNSWIEDNDYIIPEPFVQLSPEFGNIPNLGTQLIDVNADGLVDVIRSIDNGMGNQIQTAYLNTGKGFVEAPEWQLPIFVYKFRNYITDGSYDNGVRFTDVNNDGLVDIVQSVWSIGNDNAKRLFINNGNGWSEVYNPVIPYDITKYDTYGSGQTNYTGDIGTKVIDINGDGSDDLFNLTSTNGNTKLGQFPGANVLTKINESNGSEIDLEYKSSYAYKDASGNAKNLMPHPQVVLNKVTIKDGMGAEIVSNYDYAYGSYYQRPDNLSDKQFAGFGVVNVYEGDKNIRTYFHQAGGFNGQNLGEYQDNESKIGQVYRQEVYDTSTPVPTLLSLTISKWINNNSGNYTVKDSEVSFNKFANSNENLEIARAKKFTYDELTNRLVREESLGNVRASTATGEITDILTGDEQLSEYAYAETNTTSDNIKYAIKQQSVSASGDAQVYSTQVHYDNLPYGQVSKNNKTKDDLLIQQINVQTEYNSYGLPTKQIDPLGEATTIEYDSSNLYPTKVTNALGQETTFVYDNYIGQPTLTVDPNGMREERVYDAFGRVVLIKRSSPTSGETMVEMEKYIYNDVSMPRSVTKQTKIDRDNWLTSIEYYNGLGQAIQSRVQFDDNNYTVTSSKYDQFGRVITATLPYLSAGSAYVPEAWNRPVLEKEYDSLDRPTKEISPSGTTTYSYNGLVTTITDASGIEKKIENDAYGRLIAVEEFIDVQFQRTSYTYNALGKLTKIVDSQNNERNFTYDGLGRLVSQEDMHKPGSQNVPVWQYEYDQNSHITRQVDPRGSVTTYDYDSLGRVTHESSTDGENTYTYDQGTNAIGKLTNTTSTYGVGYQQTPSYDLWGRTITDEVTIGAKQFTTDYKYHFTGAPLEITLPNRLTYKFVYDAQAKLQKADVTSEDSAPINIISSVTYEANGRPAKVSYANGAQNNYTYDEQTQRLKAKRTVSAEKTIQDLNYIYDNLGNITEILDSSETQTAKLVRYTYDSISRLVSAAATNTANNQNYEQTYKYDPIGNIVNKSDIGDYFYNNDNPYQATNIGSSGYTYDLSGNVIADGQFSYRYNSSGRMTEATKPGLLSSYSYDPSGTRIYKKVVSDVVTEASVPVVESLATPTSTLEIIDTTSTSTPTSTEPNLTIATIEEGGRKQITETYYPNQYYELTVVDGHETVTNHVYGLGQRLAQIDNTDTGKTTKLVFTDHLGSTQVITDADGKVAATYDYYPFGGVRLETGENGTNKQFSGKIKDETNLNYFEARYLDGDKGRFNEVDPLLNYFVKEDELKNKHDKKIKDIVIKPQLLNSYSYVSNNPLIKLDPSGEAEIYIRNAGPINSKSMKWYEQGGHVVIKVGDTYYGFAPTDDKKYSNDIQVYKGDEAFNKEYEGQKWQKIDIGTKYDEKIVSQINEIQENGDKKENIYKTLTNNCTEKIYEVLDKAGVWKDYPKMPYAALPDQLSKQFDIYSKLEKVYSFFNDAYEPLIKSFTTIKIKKYEN